MLERDYSVKATAELLGFHERTVWRLIRDGVLRSVRRDYPLRRVVPASAIDEYRRSSVAPVIDLRRRHRGNDQG